jgi:hypothetical protein
MSTGIQFCCAHRAPIGRFSIPNERKTMGTRLIPNQIHFCGAVVVATVLGLATGSWLVFGVSLALLLAANVQPGRNRPAQPRCR